MFNRKSQEIKELRAELAKAHSATQEWANVWKDIVKERSLWDNSAKRWEERYNVAESQLEAQRDLRTRDWGPVATTSVAERVTPNTGAHDGHICKCSAGYLDCDCACDC